MPLIGDLFPVKSVEQPQTTQLREHEVRFIVRRSPRRRSIELHVDERGLIVHAPWRASDRRIQGVLDTHTDWVLKKLQTWRNAATRPRQWIDGSAIPFLGRELCLEILPDSINRVQLLDDDRLQVCMSAVKFGDTGQHLEPRAVRDAVVAWYRRHALPLFNASVLRSAPLLEVAPPRVFLSNARGRWGSCNSQAKVRLNWRLLQAPSEVIDYVVVHELAHLREMNHSARFWALVEQACPDYQTARAALDRHGGEYMTL